MRMPPANRAAQFSLNIVIVAVSLYLALLAVDILLYYFAGNLGVFSKKQVELLYSYGVIAPSTHPLYRPWLKGFVYEPNAPTQKGSAIDSYKAYGLTANPEPTFDLEPTDTLGWHNHVVPAKAATLFIGDSFCYGAGTGSADSIYNQYEQRTHIPVYAACKGGYGLAHYKQILDFMTSKDSEGYSRFQGKTVYVLLYMGNDLAADIIVYNKRVTEEQTTPWRFFRLMSLRNLITFLRDSNGLSAVPEAHAATTPDSDPLGYYPLHLKDGGKSYPQLTSGVDQPFALHPFYRTFINMEWFTDADRQEIRSLVAELKDTAQAHDLTLRFVVIPTALQVLASHFDMDRVDPTSAYATEHKKIIANLNGMTDFILGVLKDAPLPTLNLLPLLSADPNVGTYYWPTDTHMTPAGNAAVVRAMLDTFGTP
ncbi:hypothetical protein [Desulfovibrio inopinatus]|uniref:hypothetical protein n=1 Tax=Desulfovibrio inopinatus TaxID=102109 RepID=UPI00040EF00B|nr:hypothetical protein [Desulfovibrio inopinatus]